MEIAYRRELNETWMIIPGTEEPEEYECRMLTEIPQGHFLRMNPETHAGGREYAFAISGGYSLKTLMERGSLGFTEIRLLFSGLAEVLEECEEYLLDRDHLILEDACIYGYPDFSRLRFCCHPGVREDFFKSLRCLVENLLEHVDHQDRLAAEVLYECARVCDWPNYRFEDLMAVIGQRLGEEAREASGAGGLSEEPEAGTDGAEEPSAAGRRRLRGLRNRNRQRDRRRPEESAGQSADNPENGEVRRNGSGGESRCARILRILLPAAGGLALAAAGGFWKVRTGEWDWRWFAGSAAIFVLAAGLHLAGRGGEKAGSISAESESAHRAEEQEEERTGEDRTAARTGRSGLSASCRDPEASYKPAPLPQDLYGDAPTEWIPGSWDEEATVWMGEEDTGKDPAWLLTSERVRERPVRLTHFPFVIGKMRGEVDHVLEHPTVSRIHARIEQDAEDLWVVDCRSTNGTWRNGRRLPPDQRIRLEEGDEIAFADVSFRLARGR